jgi:hypothetical protein
MIFTNSRSIEYPKGRELTLLNTRFMNRPTQRQPVTIVRPKTHLDNNRNPPKKEGKKIKWGEPFWNLFHVLSEKIIEDSEFLFKKSQFLNIVVIICRNLPCPDCAFHATNYLSNIDLNKITTKAQLKQLFYDFHNEVNARKGIEIYPRDQLESKYSKGITVNIVKEFMKHFENKHKSIYMMSNDFNRAGIAVELKQWFNNNMGFFMS